MENRITKSMALLRKDGSLTEPGYATSPLWQYNRDHITAGKSRIKEWDYYLINNQRWAVALTLADNGYMGLVSLSLLDLQQGDHDTKAKIFLLPMGRLNMPISPLSGVAEKSGKNYKIFFENKDDQGHLTVSMAGFKDGKDLDAEFFITEKPKDSMVIATPFKEKKNAFYYNNKTIAMKAKGSLLLGDEVIEFLSDDTLALLDWGRGVWTYENTWYWGAAQGYIDRGLFGFNIGCGFGNTEAATENALFLNGEIHKLEQVNFHIPVDANGKDDYLTPWDFTSSDNRFEMEFKPILDRAACTSLGFLISDQHQVFGKFSGRAVLNNGEEIILKDFLGFAEKVHNKW